MKALIAFDLDGTLAPSKSAIDGETAALLMNLLGVVKVAIISGGALHQFKEQVLAQLPQDGRFDNLSILPTCGTRFYQYRDGWTQLYVDDLSKEQQQQIIAALKQAVASSGFQAAKTWGVSIENRESQITYSALGEEAALNAKQPWDPDFKKRKAIKALLDVSLPNFSIRMRGSTSIGITKPGIEKAYGIVKLHVILKVDIHECYTSGTPSFSGEMITRPAEPGRSASKSVIRTRPSASLRRSLRAQVASHRNHA